MANVLIVFDTRYGNTMKLAKAIGEGARERGAEVRLRRPEIADPEELIQKNERWRKVYEEFRKVQEVSREDFYWADAVVLGSPTRFGNMSASLKSVIDRMWGKLWLEGTLIGKVGAAFTSTSSIHGGQETTLVSMWFPMIHQGMIIVGVPYSEQRLISTTKGGSPYGPASVSGPYADKEPDENEIEIAKTLGRRVADVSEKLK